MTIYAYLRVSTTTHDQTTDNQKKQIIDAGFNVDEWIVEHGVSGSVEAAKRPAFMRMMLSALPGDTVMCTMVDRLGRSASDVLHTVETFKKRGIHLRVMQFDGVDVTSPMGKLILTVMAACAELEKNLLVERTISGLKRTKEQGTVLGRPMKIDPPMLKAMCKDRKDGLSLDKISEKYAIHKATVAQTIAKWKDDLSTYTTRWEKQQEQMAGKGA